MIQGNFKPEFQKIYDIFNDQINSDYELGAGISIEYKGELIVDLFGGFKSESKTTKWTKDTLVNVWSVTKAVTGICILKLISDDKLDVNKLVSDYWPEYGCNGKEDTRVIDLLTHRAGMFGFQNGYPQSNWNDWHLYVDALQNQMPFREPGTTQGYHAVTFGWLIGELIRKIDGRSVGKYFEDEFAKPLNLDFHIGLKEENLSRCADVTYKKLDSIQPPIGFIKYVPNFILNSSLKSFKNSITSNDFSNASYVTLSTSDTVDCPDGYYVNVDGSNTYALTLDCKRWNSNTRSLFRGNPWWGSQSTARSYMFALIALTGDYDDGDSNVEVTDYFNYPDSGNCFGIVNEAWFPWKRQNDAYVGWSFYAPEWNSESLSSSWSSNDHENFVFAELVP